MTLARSPHAAADRDRLLVHARSASKVMELLRLPAEADGDLTRTIMLDPALTAAVLRAANSAHLGYARRIAGIRQAMVMLGGTLVASLAAGRVADLVFDPEPPAYPEWLWPHSLAVASGASVLAEHIGESVDDAYTAGLLHDVGWLLAASNRVELDQRDQDHARAGSELLARWNLPERIVDAVHHHHTSSQAVAAPLGRIVVAAHAFAKEIGATSPEGTVAKSDALQLVGLPESRLSSIVAEIEHALVLATADLQGP